jgi:hypothetical protein
MHKDVFTGAALNETIAFSAIKPLNGTLFLHDNLLFMPCKETVINGYDIRSISGSQLQPVSRKQIRIPAFFQTKRAQLSRGKDAGIRI